MTTLSLENPCVFGLHDFIKKTFLIQDVFRHFNINCSTKQAIVLSLVQLT